jgi:hypothetical protein
VDRALPEAALSIVHQRILNQVKLFYMAKTNKLLIGGLLLGAGLLYWHMNSSPLTGGAIPLPPAAPPNAGLSNPQLTYLQAYAASISNPAYMAMVNSLNITDQGTLYTIVHDYFATGQPLTPALLASWRGLTTQWGLT